MDSMSSQETYGVPQPAAPPPVFHLSHQDKQVILVGTAHVSRESAELVRRTIETERPNTVCVELCLSRYQSLRQKDQWQNMDIIKVIREKKAFLLLANLLLAAFQRRIASRLEIRPGEEMLQAVTVAEEIGATVHLADRDIRTTLARTWAAMGFWTKLKLIPQLLLSLGEADSISEEEVERLKQQDVLESVMAELGQSLPEVRQTLIDERDRYLCEKIRSAPGRKIVAVVGAGHVAGIQRYWDKAVDLAALERMPVSGLWSRALKWGLPLAILALMVYGFARSGVHTGTEMVTLWIAANAILAGLGALAALAHPLTIVSSMAAAPLTSLNPMIAAGWVSGLVEAFTRRPRVIDLENLAQDILSIRGFWRNKVTRILLVVVFTNIGSSIGTFVALPMMVRLM
jgi:pheromone shutdown-related protein TraB